MGTSASRAGDNAPRGGAWTSAKRQMTAFASGDGSVSDAVGGFAAALGEAGYTGRGSSSSRPSRWATPTRHGQALASLLSGVVANGLDQTLRSGGLDYLIGAAPRSVLAGLVESICGHNGTLDEALARSAVVEVMANVFDDTDDTYEQLREKWDDAIDTERFVELMSLFLVQTIFQRLLSDEGEKIEANTISAAQAEQREREILGFLKEMVAFELGEIDPLRFDWRGPAGERLILRNLDAARGQLES